MNYLMVALGGAVGATGRYAISLLPARTAFPILTFITNIIGAVLIGLVVGVYASRPNASQNGLLFLKTGVCGGFTTFSTFSLEAWTLFEQGKTGVGIAYSVLSVLCCIAGVYIGRLIGERL